MSALIIQLSGPPAVTYQGTALTFRSRKVLALFLYLVIEKGPHSRDKITAMLWPESDTRRARASFRNTLLRLRKSLAPAGDYLLVDADTVAFDASQPHQIDLENPGQFLEGFSVPDAAEFERWVTLQQQAYGQRRNDQYEQQTAEQLEKRQFGEAIASAGQWLALDPFNEAAARRLMQAQHMAGNRGAALAVCASLERTLEEELGVAPASKTRALVAIIREEVAAPVRTRAPSPLADLPFVGRSAEHGQLAAAYGNARRGRARSVAVSGEAGMGKTRLVDVFLEWAALQGPVDILRGRAFEVGGRLPYQPVVEALRARIDAENAPDDLLPDVWLAELSQLLPELRERYPDLPPPLRGNAEFTRSRLFEAVAALGQALAAKKPLILFIDDMQWADRGTLDLLQYLVRRWTDCRAPVLLCWTVRQENIDTSPSLRQWHTHVGRSLPLDRVRLLPLSTADMQQLITSLNDEDDEGGPVVEAFSEWLEAETEGQPFFIAEMLKMLEERGVLTVGNFRQALHRLRQAEPLPIPQNVRALILARAANLSEEASAFLLAAAVMGREASFDRLVEIAALDDKQGLAVLEDLINSRLLVEMSHEVRPYRLAHDNIREVVYEEAGEARRRLFHRRAFASLQPSGAAAELAFQAHAARMVGPTLHYSQVAGDEAMKQYAFAEAVGHYERALDLLEKTPVERVQRLALYVRYGRALELNGAYATALAHYQGMEALAQEQQDLALKLAALVAQSTIYVTANDQNDMACGEEVCAQALALARELGDESSEARIQWNLLNVYRMTLRNDLAMRAGERSLELAQKLGMREQLAYTTNDLGYVYQANADTKNMNRVLEMATALWRELGNLPMLTDSLTSYANNMVFAGDLNRALSVSQEARTLSESLNNPWSESFTLFTPCFVYWFRMDVAKALDAMRRCIAPGRDVGFVGGMVTMSNYQAQLLLALGQTDTAQEVMQGIRQTAQRNIPLFLSGASAAEAMIAMHKGNLDEAEQFLRPFADHEPPFDLMNCFTLENSLCEYWHQTRQLESVDHYAGRMVSLLKERRLVTFLPQFLHQQARAFLGLGKDDEAWEVLEEALALYAKTGTRWKKAEVVALQADVAAKRGEEEAAEGLRREAQDIRQWIREQAAAADIKVSPLLHAA